MIGEITQGMQSLACRCQPRGEHRTGRIGKVERVWDELLCRPAIRANKLI